MSTVIRVDGIAKSYGEVRAVDHVSLEVGANECLALLGPSGCGKTTLLRLMAGLETPDAGTIAIDGADMTRTPPYGRPVNMMFQSYALFPHMTVADNVAFGLKQDRLAPSEVEARTKEALAAVELEALGARKPHQLSGGQRQRVALARCIAKRPKALLLDEPMAALDKHLRERTQLELLALRRRLGISFVVVTHDQDEAMTMADRIAVMDKGRILQIDTPRALYERPATQGVARFFGDINLWPSGLVVRPERIALSRASGDMEGVVIDIIYRGTATTYLVQTAELVVRVLRQNTGGDDDAQKGDKVFLSWPADAARMLSA
ncbi:MAG: ABC transporter ATP-binding protein [Proteobacteria bacterium]|nr:ABC transporter ATP-binding protein [Pseudomonadota bacterium]